MRMRRKKNLDERLAKCGDMIFRMDRDSKDFSDKSNKELIVPEKMFGRKAPLILEIGCGKGQFACELAKREGEFNIIGVEKSSNVIVQAAEKALEQDIRNVRFARGNAEYLDCFLPEHSVECIYLNFSCPFPKNTYAAHRLTHVRFLELYKKLLRNGGAIFQKTDNMHFFEFSLEQFSEAGYKLKNISLDLHNSDFEGNIVTEYEKMFSDMGKPIYRLEAYLGD